MTMRGKANMNIVMGGASGLRGNDPEYEAALVAMRRSGRRRSPRASAGACATPKGSRIRSSRAYFQSEELDGIWFVNVYVAPQNLAKACSPRARKSKSTRDEGATDAEVEVQKSFFAGNYRSNLGSNGGIADALVAPNGRATARRYLERSRADR